MDIIDIDIKSPFFKINTEYVVRLMMEGDCSVTVNTLKDAHSINSHFRRKGIKVTMKINEDGRRSLFLVDKKSKNSDDPYSSIIKSIKDGEKVVAYNRGQMTFILQMLYEKYPKLKGKVSSKKNDDKSYTMQLK